MERLPAELVQIIVWNVFLTDSSCLLVCKQWYDLLTNINTMIGLPSARMYVALKLNKSVILEETIRCYFPSFIRGATTTYDTATFCACYNKHTWQHMRLPIITDVNDQYDLAFTICYNITLQKCRTSEAFFYIYKLGGTYIFLVPDILLSMTDLAQRGIFALKHVNWFIKQLCYNPVKRIMMCYPYSWEKWRRIFQNLIKLNYPATRMRAFVFYQKFDICQNDYWTNDSQAITTLNIIISTYHAIKVGTNPQRMKNIDREIVYYQNCIIRCQTQT